MSPAHQLMLLVENASSLVPRDQTVLRETDREREKDRDRQTATEAQTE